MMKPDHSSGFTLIELLLVLTIVGLFSGMVLLTAPLNSARALESEARNFQSLLAQMSAAAVRNSEQYGVRLGPGQWRLVQLNESETGLDGWSPIAWQDLGIVHSNYMWNESTRYEFNQRAGKRLAGRMPVTSNPDLIAYANGETSAFLLTLSSKQHKGPEFHLQSDGLNLEWLEE